MNIKDINIYQLAFLRGIGMTETDFSQKEAYSEKYNQPSNNRNVREYGQDGADYGYYQTNALDVKDAIRRGIPQEIAVHLNGGGKGGTSTIEQQTIAMHEYLFKKYNKEYEAIKDGKIDSFNNAIEAMRRQWFGLKDRPQLAIKEYEKAKTNDHDYIFPEITMNDIQTVDVKYIQQWLSKKLVYKDSIDGIAGKNTNNAIREYLKSIKVDTTKWSNGRLLVAIEQAIYKELGIDSGIIDGLVGPQTEYARSIFKAKQTNNSNIISDVTEWRDKKEAIFNKWPLQSDCFKFYGNVGENQTTIILPWPMYLAWNTKQRIDKFSCHEKVHDSMLRCFKRIGDAYPDADVRRKLGIDLWGGCLNVRKMRGGSSWSMHAWGIAIDFDPDRNQMQWGRDKARLAKPDCETFWRIWEEEGAVSLGRARNFDWMHVQFSRI